MKEGMRIVPSENNVYMCVSTDKRLKWTYWFTGKLCTSETQVFKIWATF